MKRKILVLATILFPFLCSIAREDATFQSAVSTEVTAGMGDNAPLWFTANRHGLTTTATSSALLRASFTRGYSQTKRFTWEYGADMAAAYNFESSILLQQLYAGIRYGCWQLTIGSREHPSQGKNARLSSGGLTWSGNARPIPQVRFGIYDYTTVPFWFNGWVHVKGFLSFGHFTDSHFQQSFASTTPGNDYVLGTLLHEKSAFLRIANAKHTPLSFEVGLELDSQFGGDWYRHMADGNTLLFAMPTSASDFVRALLLMSGGDDARVQDQQNKAGNMLGSWHLSLGWEADEWSARTYYEHFFEDRSGMLGIAHPTGLDGNRRLFIYPWKDGLWGIETHLPQNPLIHTLVAEFVSTRYQSGPIQHERTAAIAEQSSGCDYFYHHTVYQSWHHHGMNIGTPLIPSPIYNADGDLQQSTNRIRTFHLGLEGQPATCWSYRLLATHTTNWGTYYVPLTHPARQFSAMLEVDWMPRQLNGWTGTVAIATDKSMLIGNNTALQIGIRKTFSKP